MPGRATRRVTARGARSLMSTKDEPTANPSSPPGTPAPAKSAAKGTSSNRKTNPQQAQPKIKDEHQDAALPTPASTIIGSPAENENVTPSTSPSAPTSKKRKRGVKEEAVNDEEEEPHNLAALRDESSQDEVDSEDTTPQKASARKSGSTKSRPSKSTPSAAQVKKDAADADRSIDQLKKVKAKYESEIARREKAKKAGSKKSRSDTYGLSEGATPFPEYQHPTPEECQEVYDILHKAHPECKPQPKTVPEPSKFVAGCGEVRSILDALVRTRLSATTTSRNSNAAYQGMVARYGLNKSGVGKGSVNYTAVRNAGVKELFHAIKVGGLGVNKSADIMAILDITHEENQARRAELLASEDSGSSKQEKKRTKGKKTAKGPAGVEIENEDQKEAEVQIAEEENLSMDHYYALPTYNALYKFMTLPGIGVKTAACVAMFCMQRPCFAVDTHVFRLAKWLGWVPPAPASGKREKGERPVDRDTTFSHLEVRVPDELKYMLHQLLIKHGKTCGRCGGITSEGSEKWKKGCPIDHLITRGGEGGVVEGRGTPKKGKAGPGKGRGKKATPTDDDEEEEDEEDIDVDMEDASEEEDDMPDLGSSDEDDDADGLATSEDEAPPPKKIRGPVPVPKLESSPPIVESKEEVITTPRSRKTRATRASTGMDTATEHVEGTGGRNVRTGKGVPRNGWRGGRQVSSSREGSTDV